MIKVKKFIQDCKLVEELDNIENTNYNITTHDFYNITSMLKYYDYNMTVTSTLQNMYFQRIENIKSVSHTREIFRLHIDNDTYLSYRSKNIKSINCELVDENLDILSLTIFYKNGLVVNIEIEFN